MQSDVSIFEEWARSSKSKHTIRVRLLDGRLFLDLTGKPLEAILPADIEKFYEILPGKPSSRLRKAANVRSLMAYCFRRGHVSRDVGRMLRLKPVDHGPVVESVGARSLRKAARSASARDACILLIAYHHRANVSEIAALRWQDIRRVNGKLQITLCGVGGKGSRTFIAHRDLAASLERLGVRPDGPLFRSMTTGEAIGECQIFRVVKRLTGANPRAVRASGIISGLRADVHFDRERKKAGITEKGRFAKYLPTRAVKSDEDPEGE